MTLSSLISNKSIDKQNLKSLTIFLIIFFSFISYKTYAQTSDYGLWKDHFPYNRINAIIQKQNEIYAASQYSLIIYNPEYNSLKRFNKVMPDGLSDINIKDMAFSSATNAIVIAYSNTNIDIIKNDKVINVSDIYRKSIMGNKTINRIFLKDKYAYLACGFGIVVLDIEKEEIKDTYYIGENGSHLNVFDIDYNPVDKHFYAATENGMLKADESSNLAFFMNWFKDESLVEPNAEYNFISIIGNTIITNKVKPAWADDTILIKRNNTWETLDYSNFEPKTSFRVCNSKFVVSSFSRVNIYSEDGIREKTITNYNPGVLSPLDAILDNDNNIWVADSKTGFRKIIENSEAQTFIFNGPNSPSTYDLDYKRGKISAVAGGKNATFVNLWNQAEVYNYSDHNWNSYLSKDIPELDSIRDFVSVAINPSNPENIFAGSWGYGLFEFNNDKLTNIYNDANSTLSKFPNSDYVRVGGLAFDKNNNLWVSNSGVGHLLSVRKPNGEWKSFNAGSTGSEVAKIIIDQSGNKWIQMRENALTVFSDNNTIDNTSDDQFFKLTSQIGSGNLPSSRIHCFEIDKDGYLWLGSDEGVFVIYSPNSVFTGGNFDAQRIKVEKDGHIYDLLKTETVTAIAINGNNEKWFGTTKSGVFLMSADGTKEILNFTSENSPLVSNQIQDIVIADNGEVFFATSLGIVSYQDYKVNPKTTLDSLYIYPNPVRPGYNGPILISNLIEDSHVKITDSNDRLVWETENEGGQVLWYGTDLRGRTVSSGVYYIYILNRSQTQQKVGKLLIVR